MKTLTVKNLILQFDSYSTDDDLRIAQSMIDEINEELQTRLSMANPQIFAEGIDRSDIEVK